MIDEQVALCRASHCTAEGIIRLRRNLRYMIHNKGAEMHTVWSLFKDGIPSFVDMEKIIVVVAIVMGTSTPNL